MKIPKLWSLQAENSLVECSSIEGIANLNLLKLQAAHCQLPPHSTTFVRDTIVHFIRRIYVVLLCCSYSKTSSSNFRKGSNIWRWFYYFLHSFIASPRLEKDLDLFLSFYCLRWNHDFINFLPFLPTNLLLLLLYFSLNRLTLYRFRSSFVQFYSRALQLRQHIRSHSRDTYGRIPELRSQNVKAGGVAVLTDADRRFIYYLVSKNDTYKQPTYPDLTESLRAMKTHMVICLSQFDPKVIWSRWGLVDAKFKLDSIPWGVKIKFDGIRRINFEHSPLDHI